MNNPVDHGRPAAITVAMAMVMAVTAVLGVTVVLGVTMFMGVLMVGVWVSHIGQDARPDMYGESGLGWHPAERIGAGEMSVRPLRYLGDPILRTPADPVSRFDGALANLVEDLLDTVQEPGRAGLAANQIGSGLAAFAYNVEGQLGYLINPTIVELEGEQEGLEGCLSVPGITALRRRAARAVAVGVNLERGQVVLDGTGEFARCLQHEIDHLHGQLYIDKLDASERRRVLRQLNAEQLTGGSAGPG